MRLQSGGNQSAFHYFLEQLLLLAGQVRMHQNAHNQSDQQKNEEFALHFGRRSTNRKANQERAKIVQKSAKMNDFVVEFTRKGNRQVDDNCIWSSRIYTSTRSHSSRYGRLSNVQEKRTGMTADQLKSKKVSFFQLTFHRQGERALFG
jgi:hypothetical protein